MANSNSNTRATFLSAAELADELRAIANIYGGDRLARADAERVREAADRFEALVAAHKTAVETAARFGRFGGADEAQAALFDGQQRGWEAAAEAFGNAMENAE